MSIFPDIDATCSSLGYHDGVKYHADPDFLQCLKHLIWILRRDGDTHEYRRYIGHKQLLKSDLLPMLMDCCESDEVTDVMLRLLVNFTNPALLLYREELPKDNVGRRNFLELVEILQRYKESFALDAIWKFLGKRLEKVLEIDWAERSEDQGLHIERILVLARNVLQVPSDPELERRTDNDANIHDQLIWSMHQAGFLDLVLYILSSENEQQYHLHTLEIIFLVYREQNAASLAEATVSRSAAEKYKDEQELIAAREKERARQENFKKLPGRHSRFGGTFIVQNMKSISDNPLICHQAIEKVMDMDFDKDKKKQKRNFRLAPEEEKFERRSALSVRLFLREFCIEILRSAYNTLVRHVRRVLERSGGQSHDDSYLLWAIQFFMEFNRLNSFQVELVSESLSVNCFYWVIQRIQHHLDMIDSDKRNARIWGKRLHIALKTYKELIFNLQVLQKIPDEKSQALFSILQNNVFYMLEYREIVLGLLMNYNEKHCTKAYLRDVLETAAFYFKMMEKFCSGRVVVQDRNKKRRKKSKGGNKKQQQQQQREAEERNLEEIWDELSPSLAIVLANEISLPEEDHPIPFDATLEKSINDQKDDCMVRLHSMLRDGKYEQAVLLLRAAREVWPENDHFGAPTLAPEDELLLLRDIFFANLPRVETPDDPMMDGANDGNESHSEDDEEEDDESNFTETDFKFDDFVRRLVNPKVVRACTSVLADWKQIPTRSLKSTVTILHHIAVRCKMPVMLFQARLFRIFQTVLHAKVDKHNEELHRLAVFIVRQFVQIAPENPKIFAELLFFKSIREAEMVTNGYEDIYNPESGRGNKKAKWSELEEEELRRLFMENQANPETDEDVIDWLARNLIDQTKTRRQIIMKLKQLGLIFKAPTKKSNASAANKRLWRPEQDEQLKELYDKFRLEENTLSRIMDTFSLFKSKNAVIKRMLELGLIADRSEIVKTRRGNKKSGNSDESGDSSDEDEGGFDMWDREKGKFGKKSNKSTSEKNKSVSIQKLDVTKVKRIVSEIEETHKEALEWLTETFSDALEDISEDNDDEADGIPIVPIQEMQIQAIDNDEFKRLMEAIGLQAPDETEQYWRIPSSYSAEDLQKRISLLKGEDVPEEESNNPRNDESDSDDAENMFGAWRKKATSNLVYNESDNDEDRFEQLKATTEKKSKKKQKEILNDSESEPETNTFALSTQEIQSRLNELDASQESNKSEKRVEALDSDSDSENEPNEETHVSRIDESSNDEPPTKGKKRDRSEDSVDHEDQNKDGGDEDSDDGIRKVHKKNKRMVLSDDDSD
ncbi:protein timeless homolog [Culicoides brevitarsis]|uniref:protein timeless homolog n=1 Tax=Culicoides brevitarsis TaxID=469753 RepID=UPI00307B9DAA